MNIWTGPYTGDTYYSTSPQTAPVYTPLPAPTSITGSISPNTITFFSSDNKEALKIERNRITVGEGVEVTEAAQAVLDALSGLLGDWERKVWNDAVDAAMDCDYENGSPLKFALMGLKK